MNIYLEITCEILASAVIGIIISVLTRFLYFIMGEPGDIEGVTTSAIFGNYGLWIRRKHDAIEAQIQLKKSTEYRKLNMWKAAGVCIYCFNVHVAWVCTTAVIVFTPLHWWSLFITLPFSFISLRKIMDWV